MAAFRELSAARPVGFAPGAIPLTEIIAYLDVCGVADPDERADWVRLIRALDRAWLEFQAEQHKRGGPRLKG